MRRFDSIDFNTNTGHFVADASCLNLPPGGGVREFEMETIGQIARFTLVDQFLDINGDVMYWYYESDLLPGRVGKMVAQIYND